MRKNSGLKMLLLAMSLFPACTFAAMEELSESELSRVDGEGIGLVLEDFMFAHGNDIANGQVFKITGITSSTGENVAVTVNKLYVMGHWSKRGTRSVPVNLGRLTNPYTIDVVNGDNIGIPGKAVLQLAAPTKVDRSVGYDCLSTIAAAGSGSCSSRPRNVDGAGPGGERPDIGLQLNVKVGQHQSANINIHVASAVLDGSRLRLWGDAQANRMVGEFKLNFYSPKIKINACKPGGACGDEIIVQDMKLELALGNRLQKAIFVVNNSGSLVFEVTKIRKPGAGKIAGNGLRADSNNAEWDYYNDYYTSPEFRSNIRIGNVNVAGRNFGSANLEGILIQHLKIKTHDLAP